MQEGQDGLTRTADILQERVFSQNCIGPIALQRNIEPVVLADVPAIADILCEIRHLEDELTKWISPKEKFISVTTDEIHSERRRALGAFTIQLGLNVWCGGTCRRSRIIADSANTAPATPHAPIPTSG